jgi:hypothetical protein
MSTPPPGEREAPETLGTSASPTGPLALRAEPCGLGAAPSVPGAENA